MDSDFKCKELISDQISMYIVSILNSQRLCPRLELSMLRSLTWFTKDMFLDSNMKPKGTSKLDTKLWGILGLQPLAASLLEICVECHLLWLSHFLEYAFAHFDINWIHYYEKNKDWSPRKIIWQIIVLR